MVQYEMVLELREFLSEHLYTCFFTHYHFEHAGKKLNDYTELAELNLQEDPQIFMRPGMPLSLLLTLRYREIRREERSPTHQASP